MNGSNELTSLTVLIPINSSPSIQNRTNRLYGNIITKLKEKYKIKIKWVVFSTRNLKLKENEDEIIDFNNFNDAVMILEKVNPDLILVIGWPEFHNIAFLLAGKMRKIPTVVLFAYIASFLNTQTKWSLIKKRLKLFFSAKAEKSYSYNNSDDFKIAKLTIREYFFFLRTVSKLNNNLLQKISLSLSSPWALLTTFLPSPKLISGNINLCFVQEMVDTLEKRGFKKSSLRVAGNPDFDNIFKRIENLRLVKNHVSSKTKILFCTPSAHELGYWTESEEDHLITNVIRKVCAEKNYEISLKINPSNTSLSEYQELLTKNGLDVPLYQKENLIELIEKHDLIISYSTTSVILYSILFKKSTLFLDFYEKYSKMNIFYDENVMSKCKNVNQLLEQIDKCKSKIISESNYEKYIKKHLGRFDGKSSERIAEVVFKLAKSSQSSSD